MDNEKLIKSFKDEDYPKNLGVEKEQFEKMLEILNEEHIKKHSKGGRPCVLSVLDKLMITLQYYQEYKSMDSIAYACQTNKSTVFYAIQWTEEVLTENNILDVPFRQDSAENKPLEAIAYHSTNDNPQMSRRITLRRKKVKV